MASPAFAQSRTIAAPGYGYGATPFRGGPVGFNAQTPGIAAQGYGVYRSGQPLGWDPDPSGRLMLLKDAGSEGN